MVATAAGLTVLLVPHEDRPELLEFLHNGVPPMAYNSHACGHERHRGWRLQDDVETTCYMCEDPMRGIILQWKGERSLLGHLWIAWHLEHDPEWAKEHRYDDWCTSGLEPDQLAKCCYEAGLGLAVVKAI